MTVHGAAHILVRTFCGMLRAGTINRFPGVAVFARERCCLRFASKSPCMTDTKQTSGLDVQTLSAYENNFAPRASRVADVARLANRRAAWLRSGACCRPCARERVLPRAAALESEVPVNRSAMQRRLARSTVEEVPLSSDARL